MKCVVCGKAITYRFSLCGECEDKYGRRVAEWPEWVRYLVNQSRRERRANKKINKHEISMSDLAEQPETGFVHEQDADRFPYFPSVDSDN